MKGAEGVPQAAPAADWEAGGHPIGCLAQDTRWVKQRADGRQATKANPNTGIIPRLSAAEIAALLTEEEGQPISAYTVSKTLRSGLMKLKAAFQELGIHTLDDFTREAGDEELVLLWWLLLQQRNPNPTE
jgi:hypothetical protein